ncbi:MAG TPA: electron transfer flavoprotein, partial [Acidimicrobiales bacterium]
REEIDRRFGLVGDEGADFEILGATGDIPGGAFLYTNADTVAVGVVLRLTELARSSRRPEELIAELKAHPSIAPLVAGADLKEYSAHLIPEGGYDAMPELVADGLLVAGDAAGMCLAAGIWLEGVNFAIGAGAAAGQTAAEALATGDTSAAGLAGYRRRLEAGFVLQDHKKLRRAPHLVLSERMQRRYPDVVCNLVEELFTVRNPEAKLGARRTARRELRRAGVRLRDVARDGWATLRTFG